MVLAFREFRIDREETMYVFIWGLPLWFMLVHILKELLQEQVMALQIVLIISGSVTEEMWFWFTPRWWTDAGILNN